jgi:protein-L-isoaspartate(D-aspartate) O-methyltransferase
MSSIDRINQAFKTVKRADFLPEQAADNAALDSALPIGYGQTNSQPAVVRLMLEWLDPKRGEKILDVGSGSGWTTALLATLVGTAGMVYAVEKVPELMRFGAENCQRAGIRNVQFFEAGKNFGLPQSAPFDRILVSASAQKLPKELISQLVTGGRLVIPIGYCIHVIDKTDSNSYESAEYPGFVFVPLV